MKSTSSIRDVSSKPVTLRWASASAVLRVAPATVRALRSGNLPKEDPVGVAKVAAIQAAKQTGAILPFCHPIPLDAVKVTVTTGKDRVEIVSEVTAIWRTGVEMEALTAAAVGALTLFDMLKPVDAAMRISSVRLLGKTGGKSAPAGSRKGLRAAVVVVSDTVAARKGRDVSGRYMVDALRKMKVAVPAYRIVPDEAERITAVLRDLSDGKRIDIVVTTGGTGVGPRDVTAESVLALIGKRLHGVEEAFLRYGQERFPGAMLSRCVAGTRGKSLILSLPGSPAAVRDAVAALFPALFHVVPVLGGAKHPLKPRRRAR